MLIKFLEQTPIIVDSNLTNIIYVIGFFILFSGIILSIYKNKFYYIIIGAIIFTICLTCPRFIHNDLFHEQVGMEYIVEIDDSVYINDIYEEYDTVEKIHNETYKLKKYIDKEE